MTSLWRPDLLSDDARDEAYRYFDKNIRPLPKKADGTIDTTAFGLSDNDVDAFRHAHVSGVLTIVYSENTADILGRLNEYRPLDLYSNSRDPKSLNMDLWNNSVGRKYGKKTKDRKELLKLIHKALDNGELIIDPKNDKRIYEGASHDPVNKSKPVIVLTEDENGRNQTFLDLVRNQVLTREEFVSQIEAKNYPGYTVKQINGVPTPVSNPDGRRTNNLS
ncbi:MAG: DUF6973 domain-containing protein [Bacteriovoracaceae bacterium]